MKKLVIALPDQDTQQRIEELLILWSAELVLAGLSPEAIRKQVTPANLVRWAIYGMHFDLLVDDPTTSPPANLDMDSAELH